MGRTFSISVAKASVTSLPMRLRNSRSWYMTDSSLVMSAIHRFPFVMICKRFSPTHSTKCSATARSIARPSAGSNQFAIKILF